MRRPVLLVALIVSGATAGQAQAIELDADARERGYVGLTLRSSVGVPVTISEVGRGRVDRLTPRSSRTRLSRVARWRCEGRRRRFMAVSADGESASAALRTPSCRRRLAVVAPRLAQAGNRVRLRLVDRWSMGGFAARVCVAPPGGPRLCRRAGLAERQRTRATSFLARRPGEWRVIARTSWGRAVRGVRVPPPGGRLSVLATGDSMIQRLDRSLAGRLRKRGALMRSDAHPATGISKPSPLDWVAQARRMAGPDVVVMFIGAAEGFPLGAVPCCGPAWVARYASRARSMMRSYARGGRTRVLWLSLPTPREGFAQRSFPAVNAAVRRAASGLRRDVGIVDLGEVFSPGGRYRKWIRRGGDEIGVRQADGIHLSDQGAAIAAGVVIRTLRRERILPG